MGRITSALLEQFNQWETSARIAFILAILLVIPAVVVASSGPEDLRQPAMIGALGLIFAAQAVFMWANRHMVTPFTQAQRAYLRGDFAGARRILEDLHNAEQADMKALTLLGNTYRQLGMIDHSEAILYEAINKHPDHYFPLYGFGRTLMVKGQYAVAAEAIEQALACGAPSPVQIDAAEAHYRQGDHAAAYTILQAAGQQSEPQRELMRVYLLYLMDAAQPPDTHLIATGFDYWQAQAHLFAQMPYGQALAADVNRLQSLAQETNNP